MSTLLIHRGAFGEAVCLSAARYEPANVLELARVIDGDHEVELAAAERVVVAVSDLSIDDTRALAPRLAQLQIRWTSVHLGPWFVRIGPLIDSGSPCFECASRRYLSAPGGESVAALEQAAQAHAATHGPLESPGFLPSTAWLAGAEALRQVGGEAVQGGFLQMVDLVEGTISSGIASAIHGCACCHQAAATAEDAAAGRFHRRLATELAYCFEGNR